MGKLERRKDAAQEAVESTAIRVGRIATIITTAVADVAREIGDAVSDALEMRQAAKAAVADEARQASAAPPDGSAAHAARSASAGPTAPVATAEPPTLTEPVAGQPSGDDPASPDGN